MTKLYIAEYPGLANSGAGDGPVEIFDVPPTTEQVLDSTATTGAINVLGAITAGTLYTNGQYNNVPLTGGTGSGATANITVAGGGVTAVALTNRGKGYTATDALSATAANLGGTGSGFSIPVTSITIESAPFQPSTQFVEMSTDGVCSVAFSQAGALGPVATTSNMRLAASERKRVRVYGSVNPNSGIPSTQQVSVITNT